MSKRELSEAEKRGVIIDFWHENYVRNDLCCLCGNWGKVDTRGTQSPAGIECGDVRPCICPNGQALRLALSDHGGAPS